MQNLDVIHYLNTGKTSVLVTKILQSLDKNQALNLKHAIEAELYWVSRKQFLDHYSNLYVANSKKFVRKLTKMERKGKFAACLNKRGNEVRYWTVLDVSNFHKLFVDNNSQLLNGGDSYNFTYINSDKLTVVYYVEGDVQEIKCTDTASFEQEVQVHKDFVAY